MTTPSSSSPPPPLPSRPSGTPMPPLPAPADPRLGAFWQQALALMALEQGLTPTCHVKLASLAHELQLTDDEFQQSLARLRSPAEPVAPPSPLEQQRARFREYVEKKLAKLGSPMLDASREERLVATAAERYQLDASAARQVIDESATERGIRRITRNEARQIVAEMVLEKIADAVWLDHASAERLIAAGQVWGLTASDVDELIRERTAGNRERVASERRRNIAILVAAGAVVVVLALIAIGVAVSRRAKSLPVAGDGELTDGETVPVPEVPRQRPAAPDWWDSQLAVAVAQARSSHRSFGAIYEQLVSAEPEQRALAYERLVGWSAEPSESNEAELPPATLARDILIGAYAGEPDDEAAQRLRSALLAPLADVCQKGPRRAAEVHRATWALETLVQMQQLVGLVETRASGLLEAASTALEVRVAPDSTAANLRREWSAALARHVMRHAGRRAATDANAALELHDAIRESAAHLSPEEFGRLQTAIVVAAIPESGEQWQAWRPVLHESLATRDPLLLAPIIELYERGGNASWREALGELLRVRSGAKADAKDPVALARAVRESLGLSAASTKVLPIDVWNQLREPVGEVLARSRNEGDLEELLRRAVELAHWGTLAAAAAQGDAGRHVWEAAWREGPPKRAAEVEKRPAEAIFGGAGVPRLAADPRMMNLRRTQVQRLAGSLEHFDRLEPIQRLNNLRGLAVMASEVPDVSPLHGQNIARYLLSARAEPEAREMLEPGRAVAVWRQVQLGLADHLATSKLSAGSLVDLLSSALGRTVSEEEATNDRAGLRRELLARVLSDISGQKLAKEQQAALSAQAEEAATALHAVYVRRATLWGLDASSVTMEPVPGFVVAALARHLAARQLAGGQLADLDRRWLTDFPHHAAIADYQSASDLHRMVAWQRLLIRLSALELTRLHPDQGADAAALVARELDGAPANRSLLAQLVYYEALQLRLWMLAAAPPRSRT